MTDQEQAIQEKTKYANRRETVERQDAIETHAAIGIAQAHLDATNTGLNRSFDGASESQYDKSLYMREDSHVALGVGALEDASQGFQQSKKKVKKSVRRDESAIKGNDDRYQKLLGSFQVKENFSDIDAVNKKVKRNNLIEFFLRGNEIDNYLAAHYFGKQKFKNMNEETIGESTVIENLNLDETFTH